MLQFGFCFYAQQMPLTRYAEDEEEEQNAEVEKLDHAPIFWNPQTIVIEERCTSEVVVRGDGPRLVVVRKERMARRG